MASVYSAAGEARYGTVAVRGEIQFGLHYNYRQTALEVFVKQCKDLAPVDTKRNRSDPYVKSSSVCSVFIFIMSILTSIGMLKFICYLTVRRAVNERPK